MADLEQAGDLSSVINTDRTAVGSPMSRTIMKFALVCGVFFVLQAVGVTLTIGAIEIINTTRAYVAGEGLFSKSQKSAVLALHRFAASGDTAHYDEFVTALSVPRADREAREELARAEPNLALSDAAFLRAGNDANDVRYMGYVFILLGETRIFKKAVADWRNSDRLIERLGITAAEMRTAMAAGAFERVQALLDDADQIDRELTVRQMLFADHMGEAARTVRGLLLFGLIAGNALIWVSGLAVAWIVLRVALRATRNLEDSEARFREYATIASDWFWETDSQHRYIFVSGMIEEISGIRLENVLGKTCWGAIGQDGDDEKWRGHRQQLKRQKAFRDFRYDMIRPDGHRRYLSISGTPIYSEDGLFAGYRGTGTDVTEEEDVKSALRRASEAADAANRTKSTFLANMSHELRTPLNAIIGFSEILKDQLFGPVGQPKYAEYADSIFSAGSHLHSLINDLLDLSKIEAGREELHEGNVELYALIADVVDLLGNKAAQAKVTLRKALPQDRIWLWGDDRKLRQIFLNLISNSINYTLPGGQVTASAMIDPEGAVSASVSDTGVGMDPAGIEKALTMFGQADNPLTRHREGTGLGLPLARALVELHGGELLVQSRVGFGTEVTVRLPASRLRPSVAEKLSA